MSLAAVALSLLAFPLGAIDPSAPQDRSAESPRVETPAAAPAPSWSIGAGMSYDLNGLVYVNPFSEMSTALSTLSNPRVTTSVERALNTRTWLLVDAAASFQKSRADGAATGESTQYRLFSAGVGVRRVLTSAGAPVEVSALALLDGSYQMLSWPSLNTSGNVISASFPLLSQNQWRVGVSGGIAVDRRLTQDLSVRISTPIVYAGYAHYKATYQNAPYESGSGLSAALRLAPRLELRLAF